MVDKARDKAKIRLEIWFDLANDKSETNTKKIAKINEIFTNIVQKHN